jgi:probable pyridine nucleotide-disulfide oxidoreductase
MNNVESYDILIFGGGKAGKTLAMDQARAGKRVAVVEEGMIGGSCINVACIPTKALVRSAQIARLARRAEEFGLVRAGPVSVDMGRVAERTAEVVAGMVDYNRQAFRASGFELVLGWGRFVQPRVIEVAAEGVPRRLTGERIYLNLGTKAAIPPISGLREAEPLTHVEALTLNVLPSRLLVIGGGYVGMELSQAFRLLGSEVVVIESGRQLAAREDADVAGAIANQFAEDGIELAFEARLTEIVGRSGEEVTVRLADGRLFAGSHLLVAAGRRPMTADIGLEIAGVELNARGFIRVDERLRTSAPGIWAMGEVAGSPMFTHVSLDDYRVAKSGIMGGPRTTAGRIVPYCVFIEPEFARVGLSEAEAHKQSIRYRLATLPMDVVPRARTLSERKGFMKALVAVDSDHILGFAMLGAQAGEVMAVVQMAMLGGLPFTELRDGILAHPTLAEGLNMLFASVRPAVSQSAQNSQTPGYRSGREDALC